MLSCENLLGFYRTGFVLGDLKLTPQQASQWLLMNRFHSNCSWEPVPFAVLQVYLIELATQLTGHTAHWPHSPACRCSWTLSPKCHGSKIHLCILGSFCSWPGRVLCETKQLLCIWSGANFVVISRLFLTLSCIDRNIFMSINMFLCTHLFWDLVNAFGVLYCYIFIHS